jgi:hypothetical protein
MNVPTLMIALQCACANGAPTTAAPPATDTPTLVQAVKDSSSGLEVRVFVGGEADVSIEVGDRSVTLQKQLVRGAAVTRVTTASERLTLTVTAGHTTVDGTLGRVMATADQPGSRAALRSVLKRSTAVERAIAMLGRLNLGPRSPLGHALLSTRMVLLAESGDAGAATEMSRWIQSARQALLLRPVAYQQMLPGDCWDVYAKEAIETWIEMENCMKEAKWYEIAEQYICGAIYDMRALGAFTWYLKCTAIRS